MRFQVQSLLLALGLSLTPIPAASGQLKTPDGARFRFGSGSNPLLSVAFSPDGSVLAIAGYDNSIELWNVARGIRVRHWECPEGSIANLAFSPDGRLLASGGVHESVVYLWDPGTGLRVRDLEGLPNGVTSLAFSSGGKLLAAGGYGTNEVLLWDVATGKIVGTLGSSNPGTTTSGSRGRFPGLLAYSYVAMAPDGKSLASGHTNGLVRIWDLAKRKEARNFAGPETDAFVHLGYSPGGETLAIWGQAIRVCKIDSLKPTRSFGDQPDLRIATAVFSPDGRMLASASSGQKTADDRVHLWETASGAERCQLAGHDYGVTAAAFSPDGRLLASVSRDGTAILWDMNAVPGNVPVKNHASREELEAYWNELSQSDTGIAFRAIRYMARAPRQAAPFLQTRLTPLARENAQQVQRWINDLDSRVFKIRENAEQNLAMQYELAEPLLRDWLSKDLGTEGHRRLEQILGYAAAGGLIPRQLQILRSLEVLEMMGTAEAPQTLEKMSTGDTGFQITREAKAALTRLKAGKDPAEPTFQLQK